jgi:CheY-like chemotaxis protein
MKKIIIVEDEEILRNLLEKKLSAEGYSVETAENGGEGLSKIRANRPDLILLDIIMPKMGGFEMLEEMQKDESIKGIPVIVVSNSGQPVEIDRAQNLGATDWLVKTEFDPQEVIDKVISQIGKGEETPLENEEEKEV